MLSDAMFMPNVIVITENNNLRAIALRGFHTLHEVLGDTRVKIVSFSSSRVNHVPDT